MAGRARQSRSLHIIVARKQRDRKRQGQDDARTGAGEDDDLRDVNSSQIMERLSEAR